MESKSNLHTEPRFGFVIKDLMMCDVYEAMKAGNKNMNSYSIIITEVSLIISKPYILSHTVSWISWSWKFTRVSNAHAYICAAAAECLHEEFLCVVYFCPTVSYVFDIMFYSFSISSLQTLQYQIGIWRQMPHAST